MSRVSLEKLLRESVEKKYAIGAFGVMDHLFTESIMNAAEETNTPIIIMAGDFLFGNPDFPRFIEYVKNRLDESPVPTCLHLDHGSSVESCIQAIHYGFNSVMMDASKMELEENIAITKKIVEIAHSCGVSVEGEIGHVGGVEHGVEIRKDMKIEQSQEDMYTKVEDAVRYVRETQVDALAVAIGTVHGPCFSKPKLDIERLAEIRNAVSVPLVMHGGTGLTDEEFRKTIENGINKINYFSGVALNGTKRVMELLDRDKDKMIYFDAIVSAGKSGVTEEVKRCIKVFQTQSLGL